MQVSPTLGLSDHLGPLAGGLFFILVMSLVKEPTRQRFNALFVAGTCGTYLAGGFGPWELVYPAIATVVVYRGLTSYRSIGLAWLMHAAWDLLHHFYGRPIWPFMPTSSWGCMLFDTVIAVWFLAGARSVFAWIWKGQTVPTGASRPAEPGRMT